MGKIRLTKEQFIERAIQKHGYKYDYSLVEYTNIHNKVKIICPIHGVFEQIAKDHLFGKGCKRCAVDATKKLLYGVGINDVNDYRNYGKSFNTWKCILGRCYVRRKQSIAYEGCTVCEEWKVFSVFNKWYKEHYIDGYQIDKDLLIKGNKVYSPSTCCFIPQRINCLLTNRRLHRGKSPIGVNYNLSKKKYIAQISKNKGMQLYIGHFNNEYDAFIAYKKAKEDYMKEVAEEYYSNNKISKQVYDALINYKIEITD